MTFCLKLLFPNIVLVKRLLEHLEVQIGVWQDHVQEILKMRPEVLEKQNFFDFKKHCCKLNRYAFCCGELQRLKSDPICSMTKNKILTHGQHKNITDFG